MKPTGSQLKNKEELLGTIREVLDLYRVFWTEDFTDGRDYYDTEDAEGVLLGIIEKEVTKARKAK